MSQYIRFWYRFDANADRGWRDRVGSFLRILATRIDGRRALAIRIKTSSPLSEKTKQKIISRGLDHMSELVEGELRMDALEAVMRERRPELWSNDRSDSLPAPTVARRNVLR